MAQHHRKALQEALANVTRHARARTCRIRFSIHDTGKTLEVEIVDGVGR